MDIRRLCDRDERCVSLIILLKEMKSKYSLLTRENYANKFGDFVNLSEHKDEYSRKISANTSRYNPGNKTEFKEITDPFVLKYKKSECFHNSFDKLCNKKDHNRDARDVVGSYVFDKRSNDLEKCRGLIEDVANKVLMHTDKKKFSDDILIEYSDIFKANKILADVVKFISLNLLGNYSISLLPNRPINFHEYLHEPIIDKKHYSKISELW